MLILSSGRFLASGLRILTLQPQRRDIDWYILGVRKKKKGLDFGLMIMTVKGRNEGGKTEVQPVYQSLP